MSPTTASAPAPQHPEPGLDPDMSWPAYLALPYFNQCTLKVWLELGVRNRCPAAFKYWLDHRVAEPSDAMKLGSDVDTLMLEPKEFHNRFSVLSEDAPPKPKPRQISAKIPSSETLKAIIYWQ